MIELVKVRLREGGKVLDMNCNQLTLKSDDRVVVQTNDGLSMGTVVSKPQRVDEKYLKGQVRKVLRRATSQDEDCCVRNRELESRAFEVCLRKIKQLKLVMKLVDVEYLFEGQKAIFYFTAEGRIDFRQLVRELANECRIRIEMRQIGVRDEAKMIGGFGICGRELCCSSFLNRSGWPRTRTSPSLRERCRESAGGLCAVSSMKIVCTRSSRPACRGSVRGCGSGKERGG